MASWQRACSLGDCIEVLATDTVVFIRNSREHEQVIGVSPEEWRAFRDGVKTGAFDE